MGRPFTLIVFAEPPAEAVRFHANDRIPFLIEVGRAPQRFDRDIVFLYLVGLALKVFRANVVEHMRQARRTIEDTRGEHCLKLSLFLTQPYRGRHTLNR